MGTRTTFTDDEKQKLTQLVNEGIRTLQEIEDLREGLKDTVAAISEELDIRAAILNKAIKTAHKCNWQEQVEAQSELEDILETVGKTL